MTFSLAATRPGGKARPKMQRMKKELVLLLRSSRRTYVPMDRLLVVAALASIMVACTWILRPFQWRRLSPPYVDSTQFAQ